MTQESNHRIKSGIRITFLATIATGILQFGLMTITARLLTPIQYGSYALCLAVATLSATLCSNIIERSLVVDQREDDLDDHTATILLLAAASSLIALLVMTLLELLGGLLISQTLLSITLLSSIIGSAAVIPRVKMRRDLLFSGIVTAELVSIVIGTGLFTVVLAILRWGSYALAIGQLVQSLCLVLVLRSQRRRAEPWIKLDLRGGVTLVKSAFGISRTATAEILNSQVAPLVLATRLGVESLGLFNRTYSLVQMPIQLLTGSLSRVMISALFSMRDDLTRFRASLGSLVTIASAMVAPIAAGIAGSNETFIVAAFGQKWMAASTFLPLIALSAWSVMMATLYGISLEALRQFDVKTRNQLISTIFLMAASLFGTFFGLVGAVAGITISGCLLLLLTARSAARALNIKTTDALSWLLPGLVAAAPCFLAPHAVDHMSLSLSVYARLCIQIAACGMTQATLLLILYPSVSLKLISGVAPFLMRWHAIDRYFRARGVL